MVAWKSPENELTCKNRAPVISVDPLIKIPCMGFMSTTCEMFQPTKAIVMGLWVCLKYVACFLWLPFKMGTLKKIHPYSCPLWRPWALLQIHGTAKLPPRCHRQEITSGTPVAIISHNLAKRHFCEGGHMHLLMFAMVTMLSYRSVLQPVTEEWWVATKILTHRGHGHGSLRKPPNCLLSGRTHRNWPLDHGYGKSFAT